MDVHALVCPCVSVSVCVHAQPFALDIVKGGQSPQTL